MNLMHLHQCGVKVWARMVSSDGVLSLAIQLLHRTVFWSRVNFHPLEKITYICMLVYASSTCLFGGLLCVGKYKCMRVLHESVYICSSEAFDITIFGHWNSISYYESLGSP